MSRVESVSSGYAVAQRNGVVLGENLERAEQSLHQELEFTGNGSRTGGRAPPSSMLQDQLRAKQNVFIKPFTSG